MCLKALSKKHIIDGMYTKYTATRINLNMSLDIAEALEEAHPMKIIEFLTNINIINKL